MQPAGCPSAGDGGSPTNPFRIAKADAVSEDCLFLNVFTPQMPAAGVKAKPVVVWIHGGGYQAGSAASFNGEDLIREASGGVVAVIIQYRLGVYGFLPGNEVKSGGVLNAGLRALFLYLIVVFAQRRLRVTVDQEFALKWVQSHVSKFGGDPSLVTIWGESAGAGSVLQHVIAHDGKTSPPLFRGAISSSSFLPSQYTYNDVVPQTLYNDVVSQANCASSTDTLACLRAVDATTLQIVNTNLSGNAFFGTFIFVPVVDGTFITQRPTKALEAHKVNGKALLAVTNTFEGFNFVNQNVASAVASTDYVRQLFPKFGAREIARAAAQYANLESFLNFALSLDPNVKSDPSNITPLWNVWADNSAEMLFNRTENGAPAIGPINTSNLLLQRCSFWESVGPLAGQ
ncbi:hypothetical protein DXG01_016846 [Tephrocybe rancida]|nr:hypothetical protein DXG01_016846 [Tephrocybe rancida]